MLQILEKAGKAFLVGGALRDLLLFPDQNKKADDLDVDIEVHGLEMEELQILLQNFSHTIFVGKQFGVFKMPDFRIDWSMPRSDSVGRKPVVCLDKDLSIDEALLRRDVTINAMALDLNFIVKRWDEIFEQARTKELIELCEMGAVKIIDPFFGLDHLQKKILHPVSLKKFSEDPLRFFRVMQFVARFDFGTSADMNQLAKSMELDLTNKESKFFVAKERVSEELKKMFLQGSKPSLGFAWLRKIGRLAELFPALGLCEDDPVLWDNFQSFVDEAKILASRENFTEHQTLVLLHSAIFFVVKDEAKIKNFSASLTFEAKVFFQALKIFFLTKELDFSLSDEAFLKYFAWRAQPVSLHCFLIFLKLIRVVSEERYFFLKNLATKLGVLEKPEPALLSGTDLLVFCGQTKLLGEVLVEAYKLQIFLNLRTKEDVLRNLKIERK